MDREQEIKFILEHTHFTENYVSRLRDKDLHDMAADVREIYEARKNRNRGEE